MQKLLPVRGGLKSYRAATDVLVTEQSRECPFCRDPHRLRLHGHYHRFVLVPDERSAVLVPIHRLLCVHTGKTLSLLPDFCVPRRQHGSAILGTFLASYVAGMPLLAALRIGRPDAPCHSVAQSLLQGFLARAGPIRTYLARLRARAIEPTSTSGPGRRREVAALLAGLCHDFATAAAAFLRHGVELHAVARIGLA